MLRLYQELGFESPSIKHCHRKLFFNKIANNLSPTNLYAYLSNTTSLSLCTNRISYQITFTTTLYRTEYFKIHFINIELAKGTN